MTDALPGHIRYVEQAVDSAQIQECTVIGEVLDHTFDDGAFFQALQQGFTLSAEFGLNHRPARNNDIVALAVQFDDLEFQILAFQVGGIAHRTHVHQ